MGRWPVPATGSVAGSESDWPGEPPGFTAEPAVLPAPMVLPTYYNEETLNH